MASSDDVDTMALFSTAGVTAVPEEAGKQHDQLGTLLSSSGQNDGHLASSVSELSATEKATAELLPGGYMMYRVSIGCSFFGASTQ